MMCTVQVLLLPEVVVRREQPLTARNICRRLFAPADDVGVSEQRAQFLTAVQEDLEKRNRDRWNFDFRTETPLPGRYQWVPLCTSAAQPRDSAVNEVARAYSQRPSSASPRQTNKGSRTQPKTTTQSKITDFLFHRKRPRSLDSVSGLKSRRLREPPQHWATTAD